MVQKTQQTKSLSEPWRREHQHICWAYQTMQRKVSPLCKCQFHLDQNWILGEWKINWNQPLWVWVYFRLYILNVCLLISIEKGILDCYKLEWCLKIISHWGHSYSSQRKIWPWSPFSQPSRVWYPIWSCSRHPESCKWVWQHQTESYNRSQHCFQWTGRSNLNKGKNIVV